MLKYSIDRIIHKQRELPVLRINAGIGATRSEAAGTPYCDIQVRKMGYYFFLNRLLAGMLGAGVLWIFTLVGSL